MKRMLVVLAVLCLAAVAAPAQAGVACFDWVCGEPDLICDFDASCSSAIYQYDYYVWDFDPGYFFDDEPYATKQYSTSNFPDVTLELVVNGSVVDSVTCEINVYNQTGPPLATHGRCQ